MPELTFAERRREEMNRRDFEQTGTGWTECEGCGASVIIAFVRGTQLRHRMVLDAASDQEGGIVRLSDGPVTDPRTFCYLVTDEEAERVSEGPYALFSPHVCGGSA